MNHPQSSIENGEGDTSKDTQVEVNKAENDDYEDDDEEDIYAETLFSRFTAQGMPTKGSSSSRPGSRQSTGIPRPQQQPRPQVRQQPQPTPIDDSAESDDSDLADFIQKGLPSAKTTKSKTKTSQKPRQQTSQR